MKIRDCTRQGITLIELVVVVVLILILAGLAIPNGGRSVRAAQTRALVNAKQIGLACKLFAEDHGGLFPSNSLNAKGELVPPSSANEALAQLIPDYIPDKRAFWEPQDRAYCNASPPDNVAPRLGAGENHWGYIINLTAKSDPRFPLLADGAALGGTHYSANEEASGGTWKGKKAIVVHVDGSGSIETVSKATMTIPGPPPEIPNLLQAGLKNWLGPTNWFLNPIPKAN
jgi:prepilin-type N-terminal cleavage/methylation domain-containing protein